MFFEKLPTRCKEMLFEFLNPCFPYQIDDKALVVDTVDFSYELCESPIETMFNFAFDLLADSKKTKGRLWLLPQEVIKTSGGNYRADFLFSSYECDYGQDYKEYNLVIECDGHDFHERTKQQVVRDNQRTMDLKKAGYDVIRFSGSQIYNDPFKCANDVLDYIITKI